MDAPPDDPFQGLPTELDPWWPLALFLLGTVALVVWFVVGWVTA